MSGYSSRFIRICMAKKYEYFVLICGAHSTFGKVECPHYSPGADSSMPYPATSWSAAASRKFSASAGQGCWSVSSFTVMSHFPATS